VFAIDKADRILGWRPARGWRNELAVAFVAPPTESRTS
jgi:hypothetical protein